MRQAFRIAREDTSIDAFGTQREVEAAEFMAAEALRRMNAWSAASEMLDALKEAQDAISSWYGPADGNTDKPEQWDEPDALEVCRKINAAIAKAEAQ